MSRYASAVFFALCARWSGGSTFAELPAVPEVKVWLLSSDEREANQRTDIRHPVYVRALGVALEFVNTETWAAALLVDGVAVRKSKLTGGPDGLDSVLVVAP